MTSATWIDNHEVLKVEKETTDIVEAGDQWILVPPHYTNESPTVYLVQGSVLRYNVEVDDPNDAATIKIIAENLRVPEHIAQTIIGYAFESLGLLEGDD